MSRTGTIPGTRETYISEADLSSSQYCIVVQGTAENGCALPGAAGVGDVLGTSVNKPESGTGVTVCVATNGGVEKIKLGGTVTANDYLVAAGTDGTAKAYTAGASEGIVGKAKEAGVSGDIIEYEPLILDQTDLLAE